MDVWLKLRDRKTVISALHGSGAQRFEAMAVTKEEFAAFQSQTDGRFSDLTTLFTKTLDTIDKTIAMNTDTMKTQVATVMTQLDVMKQ